MKKIFIIISLWAFLVLQGCAAVKTAEKARLEKELAKLDKELAIVSRKLANRDCLAKAAADVVAKEEGKNRELREKRLLIEKALQKVRELAT